MLEKYQEHWARALPLSAVSLEPERPCSRHLCLALNCCFSVLLLTGSHWSSWAKPHPHCPSLPPIYSCPYKPVSSSETETSTEGILRWILLPEERRDHCPGFHFPLIPQLEELSTDRGLDTLTWPWFQHPQWPSWGYVMKAWELQRCRRGVLILCCLWGSCGTTCVQISFLCGLKYS